MKLQLFKPYIIILAIFLGSQAWCLTFEEALESASNNSHDIKILRLETESARLEVNKAYAGFLPKIGLDGRHLFSERFEVIEVAFAGDTFAMPAIQPYSSLGVTATFNVFNGFQSVNEMRAARFEKAAAEHHLKRAEERMRADIRTLFYTALGSQILVNVADQNIKTLEGHLKDVGSRVRSGVSTRFDALRAEVQLEDAKTEKVSAEGRVDISRMKLFEAIGKIDDGKPLAGELISDFNRIDVEKANIQSNARADREALLAERDQLQSLAKASRAHWMPQVSLFGNYDWYNNINHSISDSDNRFKSAYALGVQLKWDLFDGGMRLASQRQAALANRVAEEKLAKLDANMPVALEEAKRRFTYNVLNYKVKLSSIRKAEEAVRLARGGLKAGTRTNTEVLDAVVDLNRAKAAAVRSQIDAIEALGELELSVGHSL